MIPFADFTYFGVLLIYIIVPSVGLALAGLAGRPWRAWILATTALMLALQYMAARRTGSAVLPEIWLVLAYGLLQWLVAAGYLRLRRRLVSGGRQQTSPGADAGKRQTVVGGHDWLFDAALVLALAPLLAAKFAPLLDPRYPFVFLGLSYLTFRNLDVLLTIHDGLAEELPLAQYAAYVFFFPTISAGPIDRYRRFQGDWEHHRSRAEFLTDLDGAVHRIFTGFLYKFILAYLINRYWLGPAGKTPGFWPEVSYMYAYTFYLFFDFAGYSAFAIGVSYLFGIHTPENFNRPFLAQNIRDFWDRWHITLSTWFRDNIYMRFVLAARRRQWFDKYVASYLGFMLTMGLMGFWHGTALHYILYGLYHGALLVSFDWLARWNKRRHIWGTGFPWRVAGVVVTFNFIAFGMLLFSGHLI